MRIIPLLLRMLIVSSIATSSALAFDLGVGLAMIDDMGNRAEPAATLQLGWTKEIRTQLTYWGRDFGPVSERNGLLTLAARRPVPGLKLFAVNYGIAAMFKQTSLYDNKSSKEQPDAPSPLHENAYNLGGLLGLAIPFDVGIMRCELNWNSHIFMAGAGSLIIFIASARKQSIGLTVGVEI